MRHGIHPQAYISVEVRAPIQEVYIGPFAVIGYEYDEERVRFYGSPTNSTFVEQAVELGAGVFIGPHAIISSGTSIGADTIIEHRCFIGENSKVGKKCFIRYGSQIYRRVQIGDRCTIGGFLCNDVVIEDDVTFFGQACHRAIDHKSNQAEPAPRICAGAFIAFGATVVGDCIVGEGAIIEIGATILRSVPPNARIEAGTIYRG